MFCELTKSNYAHKFVSSVFMKVPLYTAYTVLVSDDITVNIYIDIDCKTVVAPLKALNIRVSKARSADRNGRVRRRRKYDSRHSIQ